VEKDTSPAARESMRVCNLAAPSVGSDYCSQPVIRYLKVNSTNAPHLLQVASETLHQFPHVDIPKPRPPVLLFRIWRILPFLA
jgi:hypothetical protein